MMTFEGAEALQRLEEVEERLARIEAKFEEAEKARRDSEAILARVMQLAMKPQGDVDDAHARDKETMDAESQASEISRQIEDLMNKRKSQDAEIEALQTRLNADRAHLNPEQSRTRLDEAHAILDGIIQRYEEQEDQWIREVLLKD